MTMPVVYSTDENYLFYTAVSIASLAKSADSETFYKIYILCDEELQDEEGIFCCLQRSYLNISIQQIVMDRQLFGDVFINNSHLSKAAFYRLVIADVIEEDKCIYLDADTLVLEDLSALWETDIDTYYMAGCRDIWIDWLSPAEREQRREKSMIVSLDRYVNSGVLLFNLKKIRDDKKGAVIKEHFAYDYPFEDQDILNVCFYDRILFLPVKWNRFSEVYGSWDIMERCKMSMDAFLGQGGIIHFTNKAGRPWETYKAWKCAEWWETADFLINTETYKRIKRHVEIKDSERDFLKLCSRLEDYSCVVLWGYTKQNMRLCEWIANSVPEIHIYFADKDINKQGNCHMGAKVLTHAEAYEMKNRCLYIITSKRWNKEIRDDLTAHGVSQSDVSVFCQKTKEYYRMLDEQYYEDELQEIYKKEGISGDSLKGDGQISVNRELQEKYYMSNWLLKG